MESEGPQTLATERRTIGATKCNIALRIECNIGQGGAAEDTIVNRKLTLSGDTDACHGVALIESVGANGQAACDITTEGCELVAVVEGGASDAGDGRGQQQGGKLHLIVPVALAHSCGNIGHGGATEVELCQGCTIIKGITLQCSQCTGERYGSHRHTIIEGVTLNGGELRVTEVHGLQCITAAKSVFANRC